MRARKDRHGQNGMTLAEMLVAVSIIGLMVAVSMPAWQLLHRRSAVRAATEEIRSIFHLVRSRAITRGRNSGVKFLLQDGIWMFAVYDDGDGDGVRNDDIVSGVDPMVFAPRVVLRESGIARIGMPDTPVPNPDRSGALDISSSPVRFNRSTICSFSPLGSATPGTIFISDGGDGIALIRVYGPTAKIRTLRFVRVTGRWEAR